MNVKTEMGVTNLTTFDRDGNAVVLRVRETGTGRFRISNGEGGSIVIYPEAANVIEVGVSND